MAGICFGKGNWGRGHMGARGVWSCEVVGSLELDLEAWKKQNEPSSSAEIVLCMYLPIKNTGIPSKNSAGSKTRGGKLLQVLMIISCFKNICLFIWLRQVLVAARGIYHFSCGL